MRALSRAFPDDHPGGRDTRRGARAVAALAAAGLLTAGVTVASPASASAEPGTVVISQVYGGGGNSGAPYTNDYVELFNRGTAAISLDGWSLQYTSATGTGQFGSQKQNLSGSLAPGQYHLVQLSAGSTPSGTLPSADTVGTLSLSATAGKVALVRSTEGLACNGGSSPCTPEQTAQIADLVGYGTANYFEGSAAAPGLSNSTAAVRAGGGCADTDDNAADFAAGTPAPRNTATPPAPCGAASPSPSASPSASPSVSPSVSPSASPTPSPTPSTDPCDVPANRQIAEVQGSGAASPLAGQTVRVEGIVTGDFQQTGQQSGFYFQDPTPDADPATSDGLFAFARASFKDVKVGDRVLVTGRVTEFNGLTELSPVTAVDVCGTGTITPKVYDLPRADGATFEPYENVLVTFPEPLTVTDHYNLGRFGEVTVAAGGRLFQPTDREGVSPALDARRSLLIDDGSNTENPATIPYTTPQVVRLGDTAVGVTGVLSYGFGAYRLEPTKQIAFLRTNPRLPAPLPVGGNVRVASLNTLNWFTTLDSRGADTAEEQQRQLKKIVATLKGLDADVVGLMEVENNGQTAVDALVDALNAEVGAGTYAALTHPYPGTDAIHVAAIYKPAKLTLVGETRSSTDPVFRRPPLIQTFRRVGGGQPFTLLVNHFKSKGCDEEATGGDTDQGDGQSCYNAERVRQAKAVLGLIDSMDLPNPLVIGDLNAYGEEDPIHTLETGGLTSLSKRFVPAAQRYSYLFNGLSGELDHAMAGKQLVKRVTGATIWHVNADEPRILDYNLEFNPPSLYRPDAFRSSDHDPLLIGLNLPGGKG
ncbi:ExeM/NucH family extracellular endonuclease [Microbispora sp. NEAU-D428]|uniref:ExeM/NucH family extracellular endonuclease n=1 Tax=Microbispora sitophila TaxID=2771537 RepID=UPI0018664725|nr:ExeM/NucH family extracellular endonuclease [Microbispora sitophila]MBE3011124.1 ExeM/NucH family extracellular endonuclease [Microbispora sitophila]